MAKRIMHKLRISEVSAVDRPAQAHAKSVIMKRHDVDETGGITDEIRKDMYSVARFADLISSLAYLMKDAEYEAEYEGDDSPVPASLRAWLKDGAKIFQTMAAEELKELLATVKKSAQAAGDAANLSDTENEMSAAIKKALGLAETATDAEVTAAIAKMAEDTKAATDQVAKLAADLEIAKAALSDEEKAHHDALKTDVEKADFRKMSHADRAAKITKRDDLPEAVKKQLAEVDELKKNLAVLNEDKAKTEFAKRAEGLGLKADHGEILRKAYAGDKDAIVKLEELVKGLTAQVETGKLFSEIGTTHGGDATSADAVLKAKAEEYAKGQQALGKKCSPAQAFTAVYTALENVDLKKRYDSEAVAKRVA